jgi:NADPH:quinone reductase-like Zn-dependent oxidoreductase
VISTAKESYRQWGPTISESEWDKLLRDTDFSGVDVSLRDYEDVKNHHVSLLVASARESPRDIGSTPEVIIVTPATDKQQDLVATLREHLQVTGYSSISSAPFNDLTQEMISKKSILFVDDINKSVLQEIEDHEFKALQAMLISAASVVWLSWGSTLAERNGYRFTNLQLSDYTKERTILSTESLNAVMVVFQQTTERLPGVIGESEYIEKDGIIYINRLTQAPKFNEVMTATHSDRTAKPQTFGGDENKPQRALKLEISAPGMLSSLRFVDDELYAEPLQDSEIEIEVRAVGLNFRDVMIAMGQLSDTYLGDECAGIVTRVGPDVDSLQKGDRVFGVAHGSFRTYYRDEAQLFQKMPDNMSFEAAAALPLVYCTAYYGLMYQARLRKGQSVLIHAAAGGVGQAAIVLSQRVGAEIFVTVGTAEKKKFIQEEYGIPDDHIFYSRDLSFSKGIMRMTQDRGVDVVLNSLSGEALKASWQCVAHFGTFVELGRRDIDANSKLDLDVFIKNVSFTAVNYAVLLDINKPLASQLWAEVTELARKGEIREAVLDVYSYSQLEVAFRKLQGGKHIGKIVLKPSSEDIVDVSQLICHSHEASC